MTAPTPLWALPCPVDKPLLIGSCPRVDPTPFYLDARADLGDAVRPLTGEPAWVRAVQRSRAEYPGRAADVARSLARVQASTRASLRRHHLRGRRAA